VSIFALSGFSISHNRNEFLIFSCSKKQKILDMTEQVSSIFFSRFKLEI
jgi:hypothetical protein